MDPKHYPNPGLCCARYAVPKMPSVQRPCLTVRLRYDPTRGDDPAAAKALDTFLFGQERRKARAVRATLHHKNNNIIPSKDDAHAASNAARLHSRSARVR